MPNNNVDPDQHTHLGWLSPSSEGPAGQDHLWLQDPWRGQGLPSPQGDEPVIQFLDPVLKATPQGSPEAGEGAGPEVVFQEVLDSPVESPMVVWSSNDEAEATLDGPTVFGERGEATVFS